MPPTMETETRRATRPPLEDVIARAAEHGLTERHATIIYLRAMDAEDVARLIDDAARRRRASDAAFAQFGDTI